MDVLSMSGRYHYLVCGDVGFALGGNMVLWLLHTEGPLVDYIRQTTRNRKAVSVVGFVLVSQTGSYTVDIISKECIPQYEVSLLCVTPAYRKQQHGKQLWNAAERMLVLDALQSLDRLSERCGAIVGIDIKLEATVEYKDPEAFSRQLDKCTSLQEETEALQMYTDGGWRFWDRVGFHSRGLVMGALHMSKFVPIPAHEDLPPAIQKYLLKALPTRKSTRKRKRVAPRQ